MKKTILLLLFFVNYNISSAQLNQWNKLGPNFNSRIISTIIDATGNVYAAGEFTDSNNKFYVAKWNGTNWSELGTGINTLNPSVFISNLCFDTSGNLYAAIHLMDTTYHLIVYKWNGTYWSKLGNGINILNASYANLIYSICSDKAGNIYAAGKFTDSSGYCYVAKWNGTTWAELGTDTNALNANGEIFSISSDSIGNIYAAGRFYNNNGYYYVAKWNGTTWAEPGTGSNALNANGIIVAICLDNTGNLYARGYFTNSSGKYYVAKWNGTTWSQLGTDLNTLGTGYIGLQILSIDNRNNLYTKCHDVNSKKDYVSKWNGISWNEIYKPLDTISYIWAINTDIYGNVYTSIDSNYNYFLLKWTNPTPAVNALNIHFTNIDSTSFSVGFTKGNGKKRLVICGLTPLTNLPIDSTIYTANSVFKSGHQLDSNNWVVYSDTGSFVTVTGLNSCTKYYFSVFEYNDDSAHTWYLRYNYLRGFDSTTFHHVLKIISSTGDSTFCSYTNFFVKGNNYNDAIYQWYKNGTIINGANNYADSNITASGIYSLKISKNNCSLNSNNLTIAINTKPHSGFTINDTTQCLNENIFLFDDTTSTTIIRLWDLGDFTTNTNDTFSKTYSNAGTYNVKLKVTDLHNCSDSTIKTITVKTSPAKPLITAITKSLLQSSVANSYQWYLNNTSITSATNQTLAITVNGNYSVKIDTTNGCSNLSIPFAASTVGVNEITVDNEIKIYPNPATNELFIETILNEKFGVQLFDVTGKEVSKSSSFINQTTINIYLLSEGMYFVRITNADGEVVKTQKVAVVH